MNIAIREDTIEMALKAKQDQGKHETEVSFNGECDLQRALVMCEKNPSHTNFTPINDLTMDKLPDKMQDEKILDFVKNKSKETVRLSSIFTSQDRPPGYTFYEYRGSAMMRVGSGRVWSVHQDRIKTDIPCPFPDCQEVKGDHTVSGFLRIHTAMHVVFDDSEAQRTTVEFFYDTPKDRSTIATARGVKVIKSDLKGDFCVMECVTHDPDLCPRLDSNWKYCMSIYPDIKDKIYGLDYSIVVSHPHGCSKQISIGRCVKREWEQLGDDQTYYRYAFNTPTCPGCSGAPVWVTGGEGLVSNYAPHSEYIGNGIGMTAFWFFWKAEHQ